MASVHRASLLNGGQCHIAHGYQTIPNSSILPVSGAASEGRLQTMVSFLLFLWCREFGGEFWLYTNFSRQNFSKIIILYIEYSLSLLETTLVCESESNGDLSVWNLSRAWESYFCYPPTSIFYPIFSLELMLDRVNDNIFKIWKYLEHTFNEPFLLKSYYCPYTISFIYTSLTCTLSGAFWLWIYIFMSTICWKLQLFILTENPIVIILPFGLSSIYNVLIFLPISQAAALHLTRYVTSVLF